MKYCIKIKGNKKPYYNVYLFNKDGKIIIHCECPAGELGLMCHHKKDLIDGKISVLYDHADIETLNEVKNLINKTKYHDLIQEYIQIKKDIEKLKRHEKDFRIMIERTMNDGIDVEE